MCFSMDFNLFHVKEFLGYVGQTEFVISVPLVPSAFHAFDIVVNAGAVKVESHLMGATYFQLDATQLLSLIINNEDDVLSCIHFMDIKELGVFNDDEMIEEASLFTDEATSYDFI